ncbi:MAG: FtsX-like permease family protein [Gammaproteobacteria bacterium]|nr:FtsX-like permease family protein [Gammaproteobacteria bacterium]
MSRSQRLRLSANLLLRDWRAGELTLLLSALMLAVAATTTLSMLSQRLAHTLNYQSAELLGADLQVKSPNPLPAAYLQQAATSGLTQSVTLSFLSMVLTNEAMTLASVEAVQPNYPLRGVLKISTSADANAPLTTTIGGPPQGEVWGDPRLLQRLAITAGDKVMLGALTLPLTQFLHYEPGRAPGMMGLQPRLLMHWDDLPATQIIQPGSRLSYHYLFAGTADQLEQFSAWLAPQLQSSQEIVSPGRGQQRTTNVLERVDRFLGLAILVATLMAAIAIAMAARDYSQQHYDMSAMLRTLGATARDLLWIYLPQLLLLGVIGTLSGVLLGWLSQGVIFLLLADLLKGEPATLNSEPLMIGFTTGMITLIGFALPPVLRLQQVPPLRVLRRDLLPLPLSSWLLYGAASGATLLLIWHHSQSAAMTAAVIVGATLLLALLAVVSQLLIRMGVKLQGSVGVAWRYGLQNLARRRGSAMGELLAVALGLMVMATLATVRSDLIASWREQLPDNLPNHFVINILASEKAAFGEFLEAQQMTASAIYPMVRGRLITHNGQPFINNDSGDNTPQNRDNALQRELNLTWSETLQDDNQIIEGRWFTPDDRGKPLISVESGVAERLGIHLGDEITFMINSEPVSATVISLRQVSWDSFRPNFFMIFPPGLLSASQADQATYITSFYLKDAAQTLIELVKRFPSVTVIEIEQLLAQFAQLFAQVALAVELLALFVLAAGVLLIVATLQTTLKERLQEGALLRALGASRKQITEAQLAEFAMLGLLAGTLAAVAAEGMIWMLYTQLLSLPPTFNPAVWLLTPLAGITIMTLTGYLATRRVVNQSPLQLLVR